MAYNKNKTFVFAILMVIFIFTPFIMYGVNFVFADNNNSTYTLLEPLPNLKTKQMQSTVSMSDYFQYMFDLLIAISAVLAVVKIVYGGFLYVTSDSWRGKSDGKDHILNAIYGLLMILVSWLVLWTVNPKLVSFPKSIPSVTNSSPTVTNTSSPSPTN